MDGNTKVMDFTFFQILAGEMGRASCMEVFPLVLGLQSLQGSRALAETVYSGSTEWPIKGSLPAITQKPCLHIITASDRLLCVYTLHKQGISGTCLWLVHACYSALLYETRFAHSIGLSNGREHKSDGLHLLPNPCR